MKKEKNILGFEKFEYGEPCMFYFDKRLNKICMKNITEDINFLNSFNTSFCKDKNIVQKLSLYDKFNFKNLFKKIKRLFFKENKENKFTTVQKEINESKTNNVVIPSVDTKEFDKQLNIYCIYFDKELNIKQMKNITEDINFLNNFNTIKLYPDTNLISKIQFYDDNLDFQYLVKNIKDLTSNVNTLKNEIEKIKKAQSASDISKIIKDKQETLQYNNTKLNNYKLQYELKEIYNMFKNYKGNPIIRQNLPIYEKIKTDLDRLKFGQKKYINRDNEEKDIEEQIEKNINLQVTTISKFFHTKEYIMLDNEKSTSDFCNLCAKEKIQFYSNFKKYIMPIYIIFLKYYLLMKNDDDKHIAQATKLSKEEKNEKKQKQIKAKKIELIKFIIENKIPFYQLPILYIFDIFEMENSKSILKFSIESLQKEEQKIQKKGSMKLLDYNIDMDRLLIHNNLFNACFDMFYILEPDSNHYNDSKYINDYNKDTCICYITHDKELSNALNKINYESYLPNIISKDFNYKYVNQNIKWFSYSYNKINFIKHLEDINMFNEVYNYIENKQFTTTKRRLKIEKHINSLCSELEKQVVEILYINYNKSFFNKINQNLSKFYNINNTEFKIFMKNIENSYKNVFMSEDNKHKILKNIHDFLNDNNKHLDEYTEFNKKLKICLDI